MKVLVVDDKKVTRALTIRVFEQMGHQCRAASSGEEAFNLIEKEGVEMLVTDFKMHKMDSFELLKILKKKYPEVKIVLLTGLANIECPGDEDIPFLYLNKGKWSDLNANLSKKVA